MITYIFILAAILLMALIYFGTMDVQEMPWMCPGCSHSGDRDILDEPRRWYQWLSRDRVRCRHCGTCFKEHPNGSLVEER
jgi:hypothetical protein